MENNLILYSIKIPTVIYFVNGLSSAITHLNQNPPRVISNFYIGSLEVMGNDAQKRWVDIEVEGAVETSDIPPIMLDIWDEHREYCSDTWWLSYNEASHLCHIFVDLLTDLEEQGLEQLQDEGKVIGYLGESEENYWLKITVSQQLNNQNTSYLVNLYFDDYLVRENPINSKLSLTFGTAKQLGDFLLEVTQNRSAYIPHVYLPPEPDDLVILELL